MFSIPSTELSHKGKQIISSQIKEAKEHGMSWNEIRVHCPIPMTTIRRWSALPMDVESQMQRQMHERRAKLLTNAEEFILITQAKKQRRLGGIVDLKWTREMISQITLDRVPYVSDSYITHFWSNHGWRSRRAVRRTVKK